MKLVFATGNPNKVREVRQMIQGTDFDFKSLKDIGCLEDIPETQPTIEGNAIQKAEYVKINYGYDCFAEDTGLEIEALDGRPGVYSARYAGPEKDAAANVKLVLEQLIDENNRKARFKTVIALILGNNTHTFEGIINGVIALNPTGQGGFGYDPIFIPEGHSISFAEMDPAMKNKISHRARAMDAFSKFINQYG